MWGILAIIFAFIADKSENLIEAVNIVGSIFYGPILGLFLVAFFFKWIKGTATFTAGIISQIFVIGCHIATVQEVFTLGYLWYNAIGCVLLILLAIIFTTFTKK